VLPDTTPFPFASCWWLLLGSGPEAQPLLAGAFLISDLWCTDLESLNNAIRRIRCGTCTRGLGDLLGQVCVQELVGDLSRLHALVRARTMAVH
jgi:hypothetical protein